jgi:hypothetical protein
VTLQWLLSDTVTVVSISYDVADVYGNAQAAEASRRTVRARLEALSSDELVRDRDTIVADWRVFLPPDVAIGPFDQIEAGGHTFDIWGDPIEQHTPHGLHHLEVRLRRVT